MKVIIAGSRDVTDYEAVKAAIRNANFHITEIVSGKARGVDTLGELYAKEKGIPVKPFPADWKKYGKAAGPVRNKQMAEYADALIAVLTPESKGTKDMIKQAEKHKLRVFVFYMDLYEKGIF